MKAVLYVIYALVQTEDLGDENFQVLHAKLIVCLRIAVYISLKCQVTDGKYL